MGGTNFVINVICHVVDVYIYIDLITRNVEGFNNNMWLHILLNRLTVFFCSQLFF